MAACKQLAQLPSPPPHAQTSAQPLNSHTSCNPSERFLAAEGQLSDNLQISSSVSQMAAASLLMGRTACLPSCSGCVAPVAWPAARYVARHVRRGSGSRWRGLRRPCSQPGLGRRGTRAARLQALRTQLWRMRLGLPAMRCAALRVDLAPVVAKQFAVRRCNTARGQKGGRAVVLSACSLACRGAWRRSRM